MSIMLLQWSLVGRKSHYISLLFGGETQRKSKSETSIEMLIGLF